MSFRSRLGMFVLTRQEQRTIAFVVLVVLLGLATKHYRDTHTPQAKNPDKLSAVNLAASPSPTAARIR